SKIFSLESYVKSPMSKGLKKVPFTLVVRSRLLSGVEVQRRTKTQVQASSIKLQVSRVQGQMLKVQSPNTIVFRRSEATEGIFFNEQ
ncbi:MAG: hypothetical protein AAFQ20_12445, partial [Bacteroidota bacterium]